MVYCGKPSRGCQNCKTRRIKCDEGRPHCTNCLKTKRQCPGYPQEADLIFRNETPALRKKAKKAARGTSSHDALILKLLEHDIENSIRDHDAFMEHQWSIDKSDSRDNGSMSLYQRLSGRNSPGLSWPYAHATFQPSIEIQATTFFLKNFVLPNRGPDSARGFLEVAAPLFAEADPESPLHLATEAVSIAVIANWPGRKHLSQLAARLYGRALAQTQKAIQDPAQATSDATLLSILLFSLYESVTSSDHSVAAWTRHVEGAVAVVRARGMKQLQNPQSLLLFRATRTQMLTNAIQSQQDIPSFPGKRGWISDLDSEQPTGFNMVESSVRLPNILSRAKHLVSYAQTDENVARVRSLLNDASEVQRSLLKWEAQIPAYWAYRSAAHVAGTIDPDKVEEMEAWPGPMHVYNDVHISSIRNNNRVSHMLCASAVIECLKWLDPANYYRNETYKSCRNQILSLVDDICYSVPFHMWGQEPGLSPTPDGLSRAAAEAIGGYFLIWPLHAASGMDIIPAVQKRWLQGRLWAISRHYGIDQGSVTNPTTSPIAGPRENSFDPASFDCALTENTDNPSGQDYYPSPPTSAAATTAPLSFADQSRRSSTSDVDGIGGDAVSSRVASRPAELQRHHKLTVTTVATSNNENISQHRSVALRGTKSMLTFARATDMLLEMTRTMDVSPAIIPSTEKSPRNAPAASDRRSSSARIPGSKWQDGMWASVSTMLAPGPNGVSSTTPKT